MKLNIDVTLDVYTDGKYIISNVWSDGDEPLLETRMPLSDCVKQLIDWNVVPSNPPTISKADRENLWDQIQELHAELELAADYLQSIGDKTEQLQLDLTPQKTVRVFRYIRRPNNAMFSNLGGITFLFEFINGDNNDLLKFSYAICSTADNFDTELGRVIATERMTTGTFTMINYDREQSLVDNVYTYLTQKYNAKQLTQDEYKLYLGIMTNCMEM